MYREIVFIAVVVCLTLFISNLDAMECRIVDEEGNPIYSANAGELVYFKSTYTYTKSKKMTWNLMVTLPTVDLKNYKTSMKHNGYFFHEASLENKSHLIPIAIPKDSFIEGKANFQYKLTSNGNCYVYLAITRDSESPTESTVTATAVSSSQIDLSWTACTDNEEVVGYKIYNSNGSHLRSLHGTSTYFDRLIPNTLYCYTITAYDGAGNESAHSNQACARTLPVDAIAPSIPLLTATTASSSRWPRPACTPSGSSRTSSSPRTVASPRGFPNGPTTGPRASPIPTRMWPRRASFPGPPRRRWSG